MMTDRWYARAAVTVALLLCAGAASAGIIRVKSAVAPANVKLQEGVAALVKGDVTAADQSFTSALELDPKSAGAHLGLAQVANIRGNHEGAVSHYAKARELAPSNADVEALWGAYLNSRKKYAEAEAALKKAVSFEPAAVDPHVFLGDLYLASLNRPKEAAAEYRTATKLEPTNGGAYYGLGLSLQASGDLAGAERALSEAARLDDKNPLAFMALGRLRASHGQYAQALEALDTAIKLHPTFAAAHIERGRVLAASGNDARALEAFEAARKANPKLADPQIEIGMLYQRQKRWAEAERAYKAAIDLDPKSAVAYNNAAWMWADRKTNSATAVEWARKAVGLAPDVPQFMVTLGWAYRAAGDLPKALEQLQKASAKKPGDASIWYRTGVVLSEMGRRQEAIAPLRKALQLNPAFPEAADARRLLNELGAGR